MRKRRIFPFVGLVGGAATLAACTSILGSFDAPTIDPGSLGDGGLPDTGTIQVDGGGGSDGAGDGATTTDGGDSGPTITCVAPEVACTTGGTSVCANLDTSGDHCGKCGHSCGGGTCARGRCGVASVYSGATLVGPIAVDLNDVFFESNEAPAYKLLACPKGGCKGAVPRQVTTMPFNINAIDVSAPGTLTYISAPQNSSGTERPAIFACPTAGCPSPPTSFISDGLNGFDSRLRSINGTVFAYTGGNGLISSACANGRCTSPASLFGTTTKGTHGFIPGPTAVFFIDSAARGSNFAKCNDGDTACVPASVLAADESLVEALVFFNGKLFWLLPGRAGFTEGKLISCDLPACATPVTQAVAIDSPTSLVVDASGAWWLTAGNKLQHCPPNGCTGGQQDVVGPLDTPHGLTADDTFVYWAEKTSISRIAK